MLTRESFNKVLVKYISEKHKMSTKISPSDNLWDLGLVDSLTLVDLVVFLEAYLEREIEITANSVRMLHKIDDMYQAFVLEK